MKPKERIIRAVKREDVDRIAVYHRYLGGKTAAKLEGIFEATGHDLELRLGNDGLFVMIGMDGEWFHRIVPAGSYWTSEWGVKFQSKSRLTASLEELEKQKGGGQEVSRTKELTSLALRENPLKNREDLDTYVFPDPNRPERMAELKEVINKYGSDHAVMADLSACLFEAALYYLRGTVFFTDLFDDRAWCIKLLNLLADYYIELGRNAIRAGADIIRIGDDIGMQTGMLIQPELWREVVKPPMQRMVAAYKKENPDILVKFYARGNYEPLLGDLIEIGVDIAEALEHKDTGIDPFEINKKYGDKIAFIGGLDAQRLLPKGTPQEIRSEVKKLIRAYAPGGGYIFMSSPYILGEVPVENVWAMIKASEDFGTYPIS